jgi:pimeloyl-ACP methyl ester carboxylesterase
VSEASLNFTRRGSGPPLVLIHGLGGSLVIWRPVMDLLAAERDVTAVDLPGFGGSAPLDEPPTAEALARAVLSFCDELAIEQPHVAGNSLGAWIALEMAKAGRVASVAAISPAGLWRNPLGPRRYDTHGRANRMRFLVNALARTRRGRALALRSTIARPDLVPVADANALIHSYLDSPSYAATNDEMRAGAFEHEDKIDVPVAIAWGQLDTLLGRPSRTRRPPGATFTEMPGWGHTPTWDDPEGVAEFLLAASSAPR